MPEFRADSITVAGNVMLLILAVIHQLVGDGKSLP